MFQRIKEFLTGEKEAAQRLEMEKAAQELEATRSRARGAMEACNRAVNETLKLAVVAKKTNDSLALNKAKSVIKIALEKREILELGLHEFEERHSKSQNPSRGPESFFQDALPNGNGASAQSVRRSDNQVEQLIEQEVFRETIKAEVARLKKQSR